MPKGIVDQIHDLETKMRSLEGRMNESSYTTKRIVKSVVDSNLPTQPQEQVLYGMFIAIVLDTIDTWKQNAVRFFAPLLHNPKLPIDAMPWAFPISAMGGFDDCGLSWVPPAGSALCVIFENGNRNSPFYLGTTWNRDRGPDGGHTWDIPHLLKEYYDIHEGHRKGYILGKNDGSQVFAPWNTENVSGIDLDSAEDFGDPESQKKLTYPNIYGFKTPQKHMMKMVDGDYKCGHKNNRMELLSSTGNWLIFKDDHLHEFQPPLEKGGGYDDGCPPGKLETNCIQNGKAGNKFFKHENETRPWKGPKTPQNNKASLPQSGIQLLSVSGHTFFMDDSVEQPTGVSGWERSIESFSFGCTNKFVGKASWISTTGHNITLNDEESETNIRSKKNGIKLLSACGNMMFLQDHSIGETSAGEERGIHLQSTSNHTLDMVDDQNEQGSVRKDGGTPSPKAKKAFVKLRSGYGLEIMMSDVGSQEKTISQYIQITSPQKDNKVRGPHELRMQEVPDGAGQVFLRVGGNYICSTYDNHITIVGDIEKNKADYIRSVSDNTIVATKGFYYNAAEIHALYAKKIILLMAGQDCEQTPEAIANATADINAKVSAGTITAGQAQILMADAKSKKPCIWPVLCKSNKGVVISDRVYVSASPDAACETIFSLMPFHKCEAPK